MPATTKKPKTTSIQCRVNLEVKQDVEVILHDIGMTISQLVNLTFYQVRQRRGLPFEVCKMTDDEIIWEHIKKSRAEREAGVPGYTPVEARAILHKRIKEVAND